MLVGVLIVAAAGYGAALVIAWAMQDRLLYFPDPARVHPSMVGLSSVREVEFAAPDGVSIVSWRADPGRSDAPVILYLHGNGSNLANRARVFERFLDHGWGLAALSYRGYGGSGGRPSEAALVADAFSYYDALVADGAEPERIVLYGESLGSGVAVQIAAQRKVAGLILHAPYSAVVEVAKSRAPFLFPERLLRDHYRSIDHIGAVKSPVLWMHGGADVVVPLRFGARLYAAAPEPKTSVIVSGAGHQDLYGAELFARAVLPFVDGLGSGASAE